MGLLNIQENKTKGDIDIVALQRQMSFDLQTMIYVVALEESAKVDPQLQGHTTGMVTYNVVRRPLSGGKGSIVRHKATANKPAETHEHFYGRVAETIKEDPGHFFTRLTVDVSRADVEVFKAQCLDPLLEAVCNWYEFTTTGSAPSIAQRFGQHWRHPFGVANTIDEYGASDLDEYLNTGSTVGLHRRTALFEELT